MPPQTGIGLTLIAHATSGALRVAAMDPDGPAAKGGLIMPGDMLYEVDDTRYRSLHSPCSGALRIRAGC
jgi:C-terminal processing protease CtpA/Prc